MAFEIFRWAKDGLSTLKHKSALHSILWMCFIISVPCLYLAQNAESDLRKCYLIFASVPVGLFLLAYVYFMIKDPDRLHSEEFQIKNRTLGIVESKSGGLIVNPIQLDSITNPYPAPKQPPENKSGEEHNG